MNALTGGERALVTLFELDGWSLKELAEMNGISENATKVRLFRARRKMREALIKASLRAERKKNRKPLTSEDEVCVAVKSGRD